MNPIDQTENNVKETIPAGNGETILLVDDEQMLLDIGSAVLVQFGYRVLTCADGKSTLELYKGNPSEIDLVILDLAMPGMDGEQCLGELLKINPDVKVVLSSGYGSEEEFRDTLAPLVKGFIEKPYDIKKMALTVREILEKEG